MKTNGRRRAQGACPTSCPRLEQRHGVLSAVNLPRPFSATYRPRDCCGARASPPPRPVPHQAAREAAGCSQCLGCSVRILNGSSRTTWARVKVPPALAESSLGRRVRCRMDRRRPPARWRHACPQRAPRQRAGGDGTSDAFPQRSGRQLPPLLLQRIAHTQARQASPQRHAQARTRRAGRLALLHLEGGGSWRCCRALRCLSR